MHGSLLMLIEVSIIANPISRKHGGDWAGGDTLGEPFRVGQRRSLDPTCHGSKLPSAMCVTYFRHFSAAEPRPCTVPLVSFRCSFSSSSISLRHRSLTLVLHESTFPNWMRFRVGFIHISLTGWGAGDLKHLLSLALSILVAITLQVRLAGERFSHQCATEGHAQPNQQHQQQI